MNPITNSGVIPRADSWAFAPTATHGGPTGENSLTTSSPGDINGSSPRT